MLSGSVNAELPKLSSGKSIEAIKVVQVKSYKSY